MSDADTEEKEEAPPVVWPRVFKLAHPVDFGSERITEITMRRGRLGDIRGLKIDRPLSMDTVVTVASRLSGRTPKELDMLDVDDAGQVMEVALDFLERCLTSGAMPSR